MQAFFSKGLLRLTGPDENKVKNQAHQIVDAQKQGPAIDPNLLLDIGSHTDFVHLQLSRATRNRLHDATMELVNGQAGSAMDVDQKPPPSTSAWTHKNPSSIYLPPNRGQSSTSLKASHAEQHMHAWVSEKKSIDTLAKYYEPEKQCQNLIRDNRQLRNQLNSVQESQQEVEKRYQSLLNDNRGLHHQLGSALARSQKTFADLEQLQETHANLKRQYDELKRRYDKKVENYKELDKNYMELVRPLRVTDDDHSTIYNRLMLIRGSIESLIQKARGEGSVNMNRDVVINLFRKSSLLQDFPVEEANLEAYHLNLYMESAIMTILIDRLFSKALRCIFRKGKKFEKISRWVEKQDRKIATRWRQQLCILIAQDSDAMECRREESVNMTMMLLSNLVTKVYSNVDMSIKIKELCHHAFDLSFVMFGMESMIYPILTPLGTPFDDTTMTTPHKSNPTGTVSLVIFPAFKDDNNSFSIKPKVWCF